MSGGVRSLLGGDRQHPGSDAETLDPSTFRVLAVLSGLTLIGSFVSVTYYITDIAGGLVPLFLVVAASFAAATVAHRTVPVRIAFVIGAALLVSGIAVYLWFVPRIFLQAFSVAFVVDFLSYLTGVSVLQFTRVDLWAIVVAPAPVFVAWYLLLSRRYDLAALTGGVALWFFTLTGDASTTVTLVGTLALMGVLSFGSFERKAGTWEQIEQVALVALLGLVAARLFATSGGSTGAAPGNASGPTLESSLIDNDPNVSILGSISLSPKIRFTVEAERGAFWRVGAHDRYTGNAWIRTGSTDEYDRPLAKPVGGSSQLVQTYELRDQLSVLPAAWKPTEVSGDLTGSARVTDLEGLRPDEPLADGTEYTVESRLPERSVGRLRAAGTEYPDGLLDRYTRVPDSTPERVAEKAAEVASDTGTPYGTAAAIQSWLGATKGYSLNVNRPDGDIVDGFLFGMENGYCVYFATAMTVMLRTLDVPARFVTGYTTGEQVGENEWVVRGYNSHTWVEVFFPGVGWIPFDPTPGQSRQSAQQRSLERARRSGTGGVDTDETEPDPSPTPTVDTRRNTSTQPTDESNGSFDPPGESSSTTDFNQGGREFLSPPGPTRSLGAGAGGLPGTDGGSGTSLADGVARFVGERDRVTLLGSAAAVVLGVHHLGIADRISREMWLRGQEPTDSPTADAERAFDRVEYLLARRNRERDPEETPREYLDAIGVPDRRIRRLAAIYEQAHYAGAVTERQAREAIDLADDIIED